MLMQFRLKINSTNLPDYSSDISDGEQRIELNDLTTETRHMNNPQNHYASPEPADKTAMISDENNQAQNDDY